MSHLRLAVLGCGSIARHVHLPLLSRRSDVAVVALADPDVASLTAAQALVPTARSFDDWREALAMPEIDAVLIALPTRDHAEAATTSLRAGRHVYVEKPIGMTCEEAMRVVTAWRDSARPLVGMMGFNYRRNPLVVRAAEQLRDGSIGALHSLRTVFTSSLPVSGWRADRAEGGGVLLDLASHHIDLVRHLTGREVVSVSADVGTRTTHDDVASLTLLLDGGIRAQVSVALGTVDEDRIECVGDSGTLCIDRVRATDVVTTSREAGGLLASFRPRAIVPSWYSVTKRRAPWHEPSFAPSLEAFVLACRGGTPVTPDLMDGLRALEVVDAARRSAATGRVIALHATEQSMAPVSHDSPRSIAHASAATGKAAAREAPSLTVVLMTPDRFENLRTTVRHLVAQTVREQLELLIIAPSAATLALDHAAVAGVHSVRVLETGSVLAGGAERARGIRAASAPVVVFAEDHCFPHPGWAAALLKAHEGPWAAVGPVFHNANPASSVSWADLLIAYGPWMAPGRGRTMSHLPGHNSSYKRAALAEIDSELDDLFNAESLLHWRLGSLGHRLWLEPSAQVAHTNFSRWKPYVRAQWHHAVVFGATRAAPWPPLKRAAFTLASPLIPFVRGSRLVRDSLAAGVPLSRLLYAAPAVIIGLALDGAGQMAGTAAGFGRSRSKLVCMEFKREAVNAGSVSDVSSGAVT